MDSRRIDGSRRIQKKDKDRSKEDKQTNKQKRTIAVPPSITRAGKV